VRMGVRGVVKDARGTDAVAFNGGGVCGWSV